MLITTITTRAELDEFEQQNIERAIAWTMARKISPVKMVTEKFICDVHRKMFADVWKWAGSFRKFNKNPGCDWKQVSTQLKQLNDDALFWIASKTYSPDEIAIRDKHRIVGIHCFSNGNGRHSRLMGDIIIQHVFRQPLFTWGAATLNKKGEARAEYLRAIRKAHEGEFDELVAFARK